MFSSLNYIRKDNVTNIKDFYNVSHNRWGDAISCYVQGSYLASIYLAGYCIENMLKYVILKTKYDAISPLNLNAFTHNYRCLSTHHLDSLIDLGNQERVFRVPKKQDYSELLNWTEQWRYSADTISKDNAEIFLTGVRKFVQQLIDNTNPELKIKQFVSF